MFQVLQHYFAFEEVSCTKTHCFYYWDSLCNRQVVRNYSAFLVLSPVFLFLLPYSPSLFSTFAYLSQDFSDLSRFWHILAKFHLLLSSYSLPWLTFDQFFHLLTFQVFFAFLVTNSRISTDLRQLWVWKRWLHAFCLGTFVFLL